MKTLKIAIIALCAAFLLAACGGGTPESVAKNYVDAALSFDYKKAAECATKKHSASILREFEDYSEEELKKEVEEAKKEFKGITYKVTKVEDEGEEATVYFEFAKGDKTKEGWVVLIKEDGKWKVDDERIRLYF